MARHLVAGPSVCFHILLFHIIVDVPIRVSLCPVGGGGEGDPSRLLWDFWVMRIYSLIFIRSGHIDFLKWLLHVVVPAGSHTCIFPYAFVPSC